MEGTKNKKAKTFEQSVSRIDEIVSKLEQGDVALDDALTLFEEGTGLVKSCFTLLDKAEQKVKIFTRGKDGEPTDDDFLKDE